MLTHKQVWAAVDELATRHQLSASGLAKKAGLDPTTFNPSKRQSGNKLRWPSTESIAKILDATGASLAEFAALAGEAAGLGPDIRPIPLIGFAQAGGKGFFDDGGFPAGGGWDEILFPDTKDENVYALEIQGDSMLPVYREGDVIIVSPNSDVRRGDRVVVKTHDGEVMAKQLARKTGTRLELISFNPDYPDRELDLSDVMWVARIVWASQ